MIGLDRRLVAPGRPATLVAVRSALAIVLATVLGRSLFNIILVIGITSWPATALLIRSQTLSIKERPYLERPARYADDHLLVDLATRDVMVDGESVALTPIEFGILRYLVQHPNQPIASSDLLQAVWGDSYDDAEATLRVHLHHLRRKIEPDPRRPRYVRTERGIGYRFQTHATGSNGNGVG